MNGYELKRRSEKLKLYLNDEEVGICLYKIEKINKKSIFSFYNLEVNPKEKGHGKVFIEEIINLAKEIKCDRIDIDVLKTNTVAKNLYRKFKFKDTGKHKYITYMYLNLNLKY